MLPFMHVKNFTFIILFFFLAADTNAQEPPPTSPCTAIGQTPESAIPICGTEPVKQGVVSLCGGNSIATICFSGLKTFEEKNPTWFKFTCYGAGTLGFDIVPNDLSDNYDWEIFDVTGKNVTQVYGSVSLLVGSNWSWMPGYTGTRVPLTEGLYGCNDQIPKPRTYSEMPKLKAGHNYLLLVNHSDDVQSGFTLNFKNSTAIIKDPVDPQLKSAAANCMGTVVRVKLNKRMKCSSLAPDGSDFDISPALANIASANGINCSSSFDIDSVELTLSNNLPAGDYIVSVKNGSDNNSLLDNCGLAIPTGNSVPFSVYPMGSSVLDSLTSVGCLPLQLQLIFKQYVTCSSIAPDGSDFSITGPSAVNIESASSECDGVVNYILLKLKSPILLPGTYQVKLNVGSDGNTVINECGLASPAGQVLDFTAKASVSSAFNYQVVKGCKYDTVQFFQTDATGVTSRNWTFDNTQTSILQNPEIVYREAGRKTTKLFVTNGVCNDSSTAVIDLENHAHAGFEATPVICPLDSASFKNTSTGDIIAWNWNFGNGKHSTDKTPVAQTYPFYSKDSYIPVSLIAKSSLNCFDTFVKQIKVLYNCYIAVPSAFTPNNDGRNDYLYPLNAYKADNLDFRVYNRYGQVVFSTKDWTRKWDGSINGQPQETGTYIWILIYRDHDTGKTISQHGTTLLLR